MVHIERFILPYADLISVKRVRCPVRALTLLRKAARSASYIPSRLFVLSPEFGTCHVEECQVILPSTAHCFNCLCEQGVGGLEGRIGLPAFAASTLSL